MGANSGISGATSVGVPSVEVPSAEVPSVEVPSVEVPSVVEPAIAVTSNSSSGPRFSICSDVNEKAPRFAFAATNSSLTNGIAAGFSCPASLKAEESIRVGDHVLEYV